MSDLYYKHVTIVNDASSNVNKLKASLNDTARGIIYERHMFIVKATDISIPMCSTHAGSCLHILHQTKMDVSDLKNIIQQICA
jgi:hypothetical protein